MFWMEVFNPLTLPRWTWPASRRVGRFKSTMWFDPIRVEVRVKKRILTLSLIVAFGLLASACGSASYNCTDKLGCVTIASSDSIKIGAELTLTGPDDTTGIDSLRAIEIAITHNVKLLGRSIEIVKGDDLCEEAAGTNTANLLAANSQIVGVIGASCSSASVPAAKILSDAGMVLISPSSTAPSLTDPQTHAAGFLRTIYNDEAQGKVVANFAFTVLGGHSMVTVHDGTPYSKQLQQTACDSFAQSGGKCVSQIEFHFGQDDLSALLQKIVALNPDILYLPVYNEAGEGIVQGISQAGLRKTALMSSDSLLNSDFMSKSQPASQGMYLSGPSDLKVDPPFLPEYKTPFQQNPIAIFH